MKRILVMICFLAAAASAESARFDLAGPSIDMRVTRGSMTLPIAQVPNLQPGDKLWIKADLPNHQENHLLLMVAFLRGTTNEPPDDWFFKIKTWEKQPDEGTVIVVPDGAQQALMFVAPETGGDFDTIRSAVKARPGIFIRANETLNKASFEEQRIKHYLAKMIEVPINNEQAIREHSTRLAATLDLKPDADCFKQPVANQVECLTQSSAPLLLDNGQGETVSASLSTGASADFINEASTVPAAAGGAYSTYVGTLVDLVRLSGSLHTAQYQYIPAISFPDGSTLHLKLNAPPSFDNPKSVIVIGLPEIEPTQLPPLTTVASMRTQCLVRPDMLLPLHGTPLVFSTSLAHDIVLHLNRVGGAIDIPLVPDAFQGGLVIPAADFNRLRIADSRTYADISKGKPGLDSRSQIIGTIRGYWGFDFVEGPTLTFQGVLGHAWKIVGKSPLVSGSENHLELTGDGTACIRSVTLVGGGGKSIDIMADSFAPEEKAPNTIDLSFLLKDWQPGAYELLIKQHSGLITTLPVQGVARPSGVPVVKLLSSDTSPSTNTDAIPVVLSGRGHILSDAMLTLVLQTRDAFPRSLKIEVATVDSAAQTTLSIGTNTLVLQDSNTAIAAFTPMQAFGESAFGPLRFRAIAEDGTSGAWVSVGVLVRAPTLSAIECTDERHECLLTGKNLFLLKSIAGSLESTIRTEVPNGFDRPNLMVPVPLDRKTLYLQLRDDAANAELMLPSASKRNFAHRAILHAH